MLLLLRFIIIYTLNLNILLVSVMHWLSFFSIIILLNIRFIIKLLLVLHIVILFLLILLLLIILFWLVKILIAMTIRYYNIRIIWRIINCSYRRGFVTLILKMYWLIRTFLNTNILKANGLIRLIILILNLILLFLELLNRLIFILKGTDTRSYILRYYIL